MNLGTPFSPIISQSYLCPKKGKYGVHRDLWTKKHPKPVKDSGRFFNERRYNKQFNNLIRSGAELVVIGNLKSLFKIGHRNGTVEIVTLDQVTGKIL